MAADKDTSAAMEPQGELAVPIYWAEAKAALIARDRIMAELAREHPGYGWETNAGYGTPQHQAALVERGVTPHHRRGFAPVHNILYQQGDLMP